MGRPCRSRYQRLFLSFGKAIGSKYATPTGEGESSSFASLRLLERGTFIVSAFLRSRDRSILSCQKIIYWLFRSQRRRKQAPPRGAASASRTRSNKVMSHAPWVYWASLFLLFSPSILHAENREREVWNTFQRRIATREMQIRNDLRADATEPWEGHFYPTTGYFSRPLESWIISRKHGYVLLGRSCGSTA